MNVPINPSSIQVTFLDKGIGGKGAEQITFSTEGTLTNDLYQVTLLNSGTNGVRDIAGNYLANSITQQFAVAIPNLAQNLYRWCSLLCHQHGCRGGLERESLPDHRCRDDGRLCG